MTTDHIRTAMQPAALGLTCREALMVFSQNETLALQRRVAELEARLARWEPVARGVHSFPDMKTYFDERDRASDYIKAWIDANVKGCPVSLYFVHKVCDLYELETFMKCVVLRLVGSEALCKTVAALCVNVVYAACEAAFSVARGEWCTNPARVRAVVYAAIDEFVFDYLDSIEATTYPPVDDVNELMQFFEDREERQNET